VKIILQECGEIYRLFIDGWNKFWFTAIDPAMLGLLRILAGTMVFYTHLVWSKQLTRFFGEDGWLPVEQSRLFNNDSPYAWSYLYWIHDDTLLWIAHVIALVVLFMFAVGLFTRVTSVLAVLITISYANRAAGTLFGLDQINGLLVLYLAVGPSGAAYSLDRLIARWRGRAGASCQSVLANIATRLIQLHMCIIYLFAGTGKLLGPSWWNGEAIWGSVASYEYQSMDLVWLVHYPVLVNLLTHLTVAFELSYSALVWPRITRPLVILTAIGLHLGIAFGMGMMTFGTIMIIANLAFVSPRLVRALIDENLARLGKSGAS